MGSVYKYKERKVGIQTNECTMIGNDRNKTSSAHRTFVSDQEVISLSQSNPSEPIESFGGQSAIPLLANSNLAIREPSMMQLHCHDLASASPLSRVHPALSDKLMLHS